MALARVQYLGDGKTNSFSVPFPYIKQDDIVARIDGDRVGYSFISSSTITLDSTPAQDAVIDVRRVTEREHILVDYKDGSTLTESDLDKAARQTFFLAQESFDQTGSTMSVADDGSYLASYRRISGLGDPKKDDDAATQGYVKQVLSSGKNAHEEHLAAEDEADRAEARANDAAASQKAAADSESQAGDYLSQTKSHEQGAKDAQTEAKSAEKGATTQAQNAAGSADRAEEEADRSESEADRAKGYANGLNLPSAAGNGSRLLRQMASEEGLEYIDMPYTKSEIDSAMDLEKVKGTSSRYIRQTLVSYDAGSYTNSGHSWAVGPSFSRMQGFLPDSKIKITYVIPCRNDKSDDWGGAYLELQIKINSGGWYSLGHGGYDGAVMARDTQMIATYQNTLILTPQESEAFDFSIRIVFRPYTSDSTARINSRHDIYGGRTTSATHHGGDLGLYPGSENQNQHYAKVIVEEYALLK